VWVPSSYKQKSLQIRAPQDERRLPLHASALQAARPAAPVLHTPGAAPLERWPPGTTHTVWPARRGAAVSVWVPFAENTRGHAACHCARCRHLVNLTASRGTRRLLGLTSSVQTCSASLNGAANLSTSLGAMWQQNVCCSIRVPKTAVPTVCGVVIGAGEGSGAPSDQERHLVSRRGSTSAAAGAVHAHLPAPSPPQPLPACLSCLWEDSV
jgi:hypothetical protein